MGRQIIKQPNGKYCIFSSVVDNVTHYNMDVEDIINQWANEAKIKIAEDVKQVIEQLEKGEKPYFQFTKSYEQMLSAIKEIRGAKESKIIDNLISREI